MRFFSSFCKCFNHHVASYGDHAIFDVDETALMSRLPPLYGTIRASPALCPCIQSRSRIYTSHFPFSYS